jgi:RNA polymerase sigma-70 factor, ECF subfamily
VIVSPKIAGPPTGDARLIELSWREPEYFATIFDRYFGEIHRYLARRVGAPMADDLAGDVFLAAFSQRKRFDIARASARPWLYGIATNVIGSHWRDERRFYQALARVGSGLAPHGHEDRALERVSASAARPALASALNELAPGDRDVLLLVALADLGYQEAADALGIPYGTVCSRLNRARKRLRDALGGINPAGN